MNDQTSWRLTMSGNRCQLWRDGQMADTCSRPWVDVMLSRHRLPRLRDWEMCGEVLL